MQEGFPVVGYSSSEAGKNTASKLCEMLFHRVLDLSMTPAAFEVQPKVTEIHLLDWISKLLILSRQHLGFTDLKGSERYYQLIDKLLPRITGLFDQMDDVQKERIASQMTRAIIGENVKNGPRLTNSCKKTRSSLMLKWLLGIAHDPESCKEQFKMAKHHQVFDKTPKDAAKIASLLK